MNLKEVMKQHNFVVVGDTVNPDKYAYRIKQGLSDAGYQVQCVGKELKSINDVEGKIDVIDLCIHPVKGLTLIQELKKEFFCIVIQTGAESDELIAYLESKQMPYIEGCLLVGLRNYGKKADK